MLHFSVFLFHTTRFTVLKLLQLLHFFGFLLHLNRPHKPLKTLAFFYLL
nr:MAG TPA: hypothetical protein [Caudoviricetes sp.]